MATVSLHQLGKAFGSVRALHDVNLHVSDREFVTLVGPSGCGKSTLLRLIAGLEKPTTGTIAFDGQPVQHLPANRRDIAMVFQSYALYPHLNVFENIAFPLRMVGTPNEEVRRRVLRTADMMGIGGLLARKPRELSGGQRQRVALGRAIVREPAVFLLDEPLSNLDAQMRVAMRAEIKRLHVELRKTFIYVTHDQAEALTMSDRIAVLNEGVIQQLGTPAEVYGSPRNTFVAGFIGSPPMSFVPGRLDTVDGGLRFTAGEVACSLPTALLPRFASPGQAQITLGIRPEDVSVETEPRDGALPATIYVHEPLGADLYLTLRVGEHLIKARTSPDRQIDVGDRVWTCFRVDRVRFFDSTTGVALHGNA